MGLDAKLYRQRELATFPRAAILDRVEQAVVFLFFGLLCERIVRSGNPFAAVTLVSEGAIAICVLIRQPTSDISYRPLDWVLAIIATTGSLLVVPIHASPPQLIVPAVALVAAGNAFQLSAKLVMRRSFGIGPANRGVKVSGPYKLVRHPMYAGYFVANMGVLMLMPSWYNLMVYLTAWTAQAFRLEAEEKLLSKDPAYCALRKHVRFLVVPGLY